MSTAEAPRGGTASVNSAGVSLLLSRFLSAAPVRAAGGQSSDGQFSWMDGETEDLEGETLAALMEGALSDPEALPWDIVNETLQRTAFDFDVETLHLYLVTHDFVLAAVTDLGADPDPVDRAVVEILSNLRQFV